MLHKDKQIFLSLVLLGRVHITVASYQIARYSPSRDLKEPTYHIPTYILHHMYVYQIARRVARVSMYHSKRLQ